MARYLQVTLRRAKNINACTATKARTMVIAKASYKTTIYTTSKAEDMGQNPVFEKDGTNVFDFVYENETEYITLELFNRNHSCIGKSKLQFSELAKLMPEQNPEEKVLPVNVVSLGGYQKQCGELVLTAQIKQQPAMGEQGNLSIVLQKGHFDGITSIFKSKTTKVCAKLTYKHITLVSGILQDMGNKFVWHEENTFLFTINSSKPDDALEIEVYNGSAKVGECKIKMSLLIKGEEDLRADPRAEVTQTADLVVGKKTVGSIEVAATFTKSHMGRRNSYPPEHTAAPHPHPHPQWQHQHQRAPSYHAHAHTSQPNMYAGSEFNRSQSEKAGFYPPEPELYPPEPGLYPPEHHPVQTDHIPRPTPGQYEPSAPPVYPAGGPPHHFQAHGAHGAHGTSREERAYFKDHPEISDFVGSFH